MVFLSVWGTKPVLDAFHLSLQVPGGRRRSGRVAGAEEANRMVKAPRPGLPAEREKDLCFLFKQA